MTDNRYILGSSPAALGRLKLQAAILLGEPSDHLLRDIELTRVEVCCGLQGSTTDSRRNRFSHRSRCLAPAIAFPPFR